MSVTLQISSPTGWFNPKTKHQNKKHTHKTYHFLQYLIWWHKKNSSTRFTKRPTKSRHPFVSRAPWLPVVSALRVHPWFGRGDPPALCVALRPMIENIQLPNWTVEEVDSKTWGWLEMLNLIEFQKRSRRSCDQLMATHIAWEPQPIRGEGKICETSSIFKYWGKESISTTNSSLEFHGISIWIVRAKLVIKCI